MPLSNPRLLIVIRAGRDSIHRSWLWTLRQQADVAVSSYDGSELSGPGIRYAHQFAGGKLQGIMAFMEEYPSIIDEYDYFMLLDDDLILSFDSLRRIVALLGRFPFPLASPALSYDSFFSWPLMLANDRFLFRCTDFVEVMMPIMSREFMLAAMPAFNDNFSGWGHEWLWRKMLNERRTFAAIFDSAPVTHTRPTGRSDFLKDRPPDAPTLQQELETMLAKYQLDESIPFRNYFGVTNGDPPRLLIQDTFVEVAREGYRNMQSLPEDTMTSCIHTLTYDSRPIASVADLQKTQGFRLVAEALRA